MGTDAEAAGEVEAVCGLPVGADTRVEVDLSAALSPGFVEQPLEESGGVAPAPCARDGGQVVDVEVATPREVVGDAKATNRRNRAVDPVHDRDQPVAGGTLPLVDLLDEGIARPQAWPQLQHRLVGPAGLWRQQLADHDGDDASVGAPLPGCSE